MVENVGLLTIIVSQCLKMDFMNHAREGLTCGIIVNSNVVDHV